MPDVSAGPPLVGVVSANRAYFGLKNLSLLFDSFVTESMGLDKDPTFPYNKRRYLNDLEWLLGAGLLKEHDHYWHSVEALESSVHQTALSRLKRLNEEADEFTKKRSLTEEERNAFLESWRERNDLVVKMIANDLRISSQQNAQPICHMLHDSGRSSSSTTVVRVVLSCLPQPGPLNSWDDILAFKADAQTAHKLWGLKRWMTKLSEGGYSGDSLRDEIEYTIQDYSNFLLKSGLKTQSGVIETVLVSTAEALEDLVKLRFSKFLKSALTLRRSNVELVEAEAKAPGRECAYIVSARERFSDPSKGTLFC